MYLSRAVDSQGNTQECQLSPTRDARAAKRFFAKALGACHTVIPRVITVDKNAAYPKATATLSPVLALYLAPDGELYVKLQKLLAQDQEGLLPLAPLIPSSGLARRNLGTVSLRENGPQ